MKKRITIFISLLVSITMFISCNNQASNEANAGGTKVLKGRFVNTENGIRSFTFQTDGSFQRGGAVSGTVGGTTDYVAGTHDEGSYQLDGKTIHLVYKNGDKEDLPIEIFPSSEKDARAETPFRISVNNVTYTNVSE